MEQQAANSAAQRPGCNTKRSMENKFERFNMLFLAIQSL
jgi:hypothetical protein